MDTKLLARIGAGAFVAVVATMTLLDLREKPEAGPPAMIAVFEPDGDPLPAQLRACAAMGEVALSVPDCRAAWAEKRRRFLGQDKGSPIVAVPPEDASAPNGDVPIAIPTAIASYAVAAPADVAPKGAATGVR